jgi:hypothetical protein
VHHLPGLYRVAGIFLACLLSACGSSDGDSPTRSTGLTVSTDSLVFEASGPNAAAPAPQVITATFGEGVVNLAVINNGENMAAIETAVNGQTAQITVTPAAPSAVGSGIFIGAIAITPYFCANSGCSSLTAGETRTVRMRYQISPMVVNVTPYVATANTSDSVIISGVGFSSFAPTGVRFGDVAATEFLVVADNEIRATHPALPAGSYEIQIELPDHVGKLESTAELLVLEPRTYTAQTLAYPTANPTINRLAYDAERNAVFVATSDAILRYPASGSTWGAVESAAVNELQDIALSPSGAELLTLTRSSLLPADPITLALGTARTATLASGTYLKNLAVLYDRRVLITSGRNESGASALYWYSPEQDSVNSLTQALNNATPATSGNGVTVIFVQGHSSTTTSLPVYLYSTSRNQFDVLGTSIHQNAVTPVIDRNGTRAVLNGVSVHGDQFAQYGTLPNTIVALALRSDGSRVYAYDPTAGGIVTYNITETKDGGAYTAVGTTVPLVGDPGANPKMIITPDGNTLFIAGSTQLVVQPTPSF